MRFDPQAALKQLGGGDAPPTDPAPPSGPAPRVAQVARVARPHLSKSGAPTESLMACSNVRAGAREEFPAYKKADPHAPSLPSDPDTYLAALTLHGPMTYGAAAVALGWGATRAWQADARIRAAGRNAIDKSGKTYPGPCRDDGRGG